MFRFSRDSRPPLTDAKTASRWLEDLPKADLLDQQARVLAALNEVAEGRVNPTPGTAAALIAIDESCATLRRALTAQYVDLATRPGQVERRVWQAAFDLIQGFLHCYQQVAAAMEAAGGRRWQAMQPRLILHWLHHLSLDAKYRLFHFEHWIPGKWQQLNALYARARSLRIERTKLPLALANTSTIECEYLQAVLLQMLNAGNLSPMQTATVADQLGEWAELVEVSTDPARSPPWWIDLQGMSGARRFQPAQEVAGTPLFLDTRPLQAHLIKAQVLIRRKLAADPLSERTPRRVNQLDLLLRLSRQIEPESSPLARRVARVPKSGDAFAIVGFARIAGTLREEDLRAAAGLHTIAETLRDATSGTTLDPVSQANHPPRRQLAYAAAVESWELRDASTSGLRVSAPVADTTAYGIGTLVVVRTQDAPEWSLAAIRRVRRIASDRAEFGLQLLSDSLLGVELEASHATDAGYSVDGQSVSLASMRYRALYVSRRNNPAAGQVRSLIVPVNAYDSRIPYGLTTARARYTVRLGDVIERQHDWVWCALEVLTAPPSDVTVPPQRA